MCVKMLDCQDCIFQNIRDTGDDLHIHNSKPAIGSYGGKL